MKNIKLVYNVINYDINARAAKVFNVFNNCSLLEAALDEIEKYMRDPEKYDYTFGGWGEEPKTVYGFDAFVKRIDSLIAWQERGRCEYEMGVGDKFITEVSDIIKDTKSFTTAEEFKDYLRKEERRNARLTAWDCYDQAHMNIEVVCREILRQYEVAVG